MAPGTTEASNATKGIRRVLAVAAVALGAFVVSIFVLADDARLGCAVDAQRDPAYQAKLLGQLEIERTDYDIEVTRDAQPITGARVCASLAMMGMEAMGVSDTAEEVAPGIYRVALVLEMSGGWEGNILITEEGKPPVSVPLKVAVA